jgi:hypothetical protein
VPSAPSFPGYPATPPVPPPPLMRPKSDPCGEAEVRAAQSLVADLALLLGVREAVAAATGLMNYHK